MSHGTFRTRHIVAFLSLVSILLLPLAGLAADKKSNAAPATWPGWDAEKDKVPVDKRAGKDKDKIVWVGTGEGNGRNSSSWGGGVY